MLRGLKIEVWCDEGSIYNLLEDWKNALKADLGEARHSGQWGHPLLNTFMCVFTVQYLRLLGWGYELWRPGRYIPLVCSNARWIWRQAIVRRPTGGVCNIVVKIGIISVHIQLNKLYFCLLEFELNNQNQHLRTGDWFTWTYGYMSDFIFLPTVWRKAGQNLLHDFLNIRNKKNSAIRTRIFFPWGNELKILTGGQLDKIGQILPSFASSPQLRGLERDI